MPSKKVFIKSTRPFIHEQIRTEAAIEQLKNSKKGLGSYFANRNSTRQGSGLLEDEIKLLLPLILDIPATDLEFRKKVNLYYADINTVIPYEKGLEVEIGLELDNEKSVNYIEEEVLEVEGKPTRIVKKYNTPINVEDYIRYRHALKHPYCAGSPDEAKGNSLMHFYVEDPEQTTKARLLENEMKDKANNLYQEVKSDPRRVKMILTVLRFDVPKKQGEVGSSVNVRAMSEDDRVLRLRTLAEAKPDLFYKAGTDKILKEKYLTDELITVGLLKKVGQSVLVSDTLEVLGNTVEEAVIALFQDNRNSGLLSTLKAKYTEKVA